MNNSTWSQNLNIYQVPQVPLVTPSLGTAAITTGGVDGSKVVQVTWVILWIPGCACETHPKKFVLHLTTFGRMASVAIQS